MSTKKLAKELGLVRKHSKSSTGQKRALISNQIFAYLIVIDFESTCWREKNNFGQEIIEFPAVLLNTSTGEVESEFQTYVQPQEHPILSEFCSELTGITQAQVEVGVPLQICLSRFSRWLQTLQLQRGVVFPKDQRGSSASSSQKPCAFLTWSDWDLGVCLQYECKRKQLSKPDVLNSWIDLRATYKLFYSRKPKGLNGALQDLGIQFAGREHSGLDDARNTARLADRMMRDGCVLKITRSLERAPLKAKPLFGNIGDCPGNKKENDNTKPEAPAAISRSPAKGSPGPRQKELRLSNIRPVVDKKKNPPTISPDYQSLVSPKTLLNGLTTPLYGNSSHTFEPEPTVEGSGGEVTLVSEVEEGRGSYDDVMLEYDDVDDAYPEDERPKPVVKELNVSAVHLRLQTESKSKNLFTIYTDLEKHSTAALQPPM
ncbi:ERI1 exoribonuclease 2 [Aplochiton taeniatus]